MILAAALANLGPDVGRTWPDVIDEHAQVGVLLALVAVFLVVFFVATLFLVVAYRRAVEEGRSFDAVGGWLFKLGAPGPTGGANGTDGDKGGSSGEGLAGGTSSGRVVVATGAAGADALADTPAHPTARGALAIVRAALEIATAKTEAEANDREGYLLTALFNSTTHQEGAMRRASLLKVSDDASGDRAMRVHQGFPETSFRKPYTRFSAKAFRENGAGLCWAAVHACGGGHAGDSIKRNVFHAPDVSKETSFVSTPGHHVFRSVLIAPVGANGHLFGAICLDSEEIDHYEEDDQHMVAAAALALAVAWQARRAMEASMPSRGSAASGSAAGAGGGAPIGGASAGTGAAQIAEAGGGPPTSGGALAR